MGKASADPQAYRREREQEGQVGKREWDRCVGWDGRYLTRSGVYECGPGPELQIYEEKRSERTYIEVFYVV